VKKSFTVIIDTTDAPYQRKILEILFTLRVKN